MYMDSQNSILPDSVISHVTELNHNDSMNKMPDAFWSHLTTMSELIVAIHLHVLTMLAVKK